MTIAPLLLPAGTTAPLWKRKRVHSSVQVSVGVAGRALSAGTTFGSYWFSVEPIWPLALLAM